MSWPVVPLESLAADEPRAITDGPFGSNLARRHYTEAGPRVIRLQNIGDGRFIDNPAHISREHFESLRAHEVRGGDLLVASLGEVLPRACLAPDGLGPAIVKADCIRIRLGDQVDPRWVLYALQRPAARQWADAHRHGVGRPRLGLKALRQLPIPRPSPSVQQRVVSVLEDYLSRLDAAAASLSSAGARTQVLGSQVLLDALNSVQTENVELSRTLVQPLANGRSVQTLAGGFPVLRLTALRDGRIDLAQRKEGAWDRADAERFLVEKGDFLIARGNGSLRLVGVGGLVIEDPDPIAYPDTLIRARPDPTLLSPEFLALVWNSRIVRRQIEASARTTAGIYKVNQKDLGSVLVPLPSLSDQTDVVVRVHELREGVARLAATEELATQRMESLRRSLLAAAFSGRLPSDMRRKQMDRVNP